MTTPAQSFTYRSAQSGSLLAGIGLVIAIETTVLHVVLVTHHPVIAWALTLSSLGALVWLVNDYRALGTGAVRVGRGEIVLRVGRRFAIQLRTTTVAHVARPSWRDIPTAGTPEAVGYMNLMKPAAPNVLLTLAEPVTVPLPGGMRRTASRLGLKLDHPDAFVSAVDAESPTRAASRP